MGLTLDNLEARLRTVEEHLGFRDKLESDDKSPENTPEITPETKPEGE